MQVVLLERVEKLGQMGDVVKVKDGFARNFLLPQKKALRATKANLEQFQARKAQLEANNLEQRKEAEAVAAKMGVLTVVLLRQASEGGQLYGSVSSRDIAEAVSAAGFTIARNQVQLNTSIKNLGIHSLQVSLHPEVAVKVNVNVARSETEAEAQAKGTPAGPAPEEIFDNPDAQAPATETGDSTAG